MSSLLDEFNPLGGAANGAAGSATPGCGDLSLEVKGVLERVLRADTGGGRVPRMHFLRWFVPLGRIWDADNSTFRSVEWERG